ncbi:MAG TPA: ABC transporter substrate-binding protein [Candidatus Binatia bacterium]|nr:ABC transporter substrate-binding protein [Candidatus Binatia bacterium]
MNRFQQRLALIGIVLFTCFGAVQDSAGQSSTLTAFYTAPVASMAPMWIAKEAGFFKKQGLDVKLVFIASGPVGTASVLGGETDVGIIGGFAPTRAILGGAKALVIIGQSKNLITSKIIGKNEIASVQDLKGRRLGIDRIGSNPDMFAQVALARFHIDTFKDLQYVQLGSIGQALPALKAGSVDAIIAGAPHDLFALRLGFKEIVDIAAMNIPFAATVLVSARETVARKQSELSKFMRAYAEAMHYFLTNKEGTAQIVAKYTKVEDREINNYAIGSESKAMERTLQVDPKGIELILGLISKTVPQAASAKAEDFYDARFYTELRDSGFLKRLWGDKY